MGYVDITLDTSTLRGDVGRTVSIFTNDPTEPGTFVVVRATILAAVDVYPAAGAILDNRSSEGKSALLLLRKVITQPGKLTVSDVVSSADWLSVQARAAEPGVALDPEIPETWPGDWILEIALDGPVELGQSQQTIRFRTGLEREPVVELPIAVTGWPAVNVSTERLIIGATPGDGPGVASAVFSLRRDLDPESLEVVAEPSTIGVRFERTGRRHFKLEASWPGGSEREGAIRFRLGAEEFRLPVELRPG